MILLKISKNQTAYYMFVNHMETVEDPVYTKTVSISLTQTSPVKYNFIDPV